MKSWDNMMLGCIFLTMRDIHEVNLLNAGYSKEIIPKFFESFITFLNACEQKRDAKKVEEMNHRLKKATNGPAYNKRQSKKKSTLITLGKKVGSLKPPMVGDPKVIIQKVMKQDHLSGRTTLSKVPGAICPKCFHSQIYYVSKPSDLFNTSMQVAESWEEFNRGITKKGTKAKAKDVKAETAKVAGKPLVPMVVCMCCVNRARNVFGEGCIECEGKEGGNEWDNVLNESMCNVCDCDCDIYFNLKLSNEVSLYLEEKRLVNEKEMKEVKQRKMKQMKDFGPLPLGKCCIDLICITYVKKRCPVMYASSLSSHQQIKAKSPTFLNSSAKIPIPLQSFLLLLAWLVSKNKSASSSSTTNTTRTTRSTLWKVAWSSSKKR